MNGQVRLDWTPKTGSGDIEFFFVAPSTGWIGMGFSPNGEMNGADMVIGGVRNGSPYFNDRYSASNTLPVVDKQQNYQLISGAENGTHTWLRFSRKIDTTDASQDYQITNEPVEVIWAYGDKDPGTGEEPAYHGRQRGGRTLSLLDATGNVGPTSSPPKGGRKPKHSSEESSNDSSEEGRG
ncbi:unnamed protein product [Darwinula stevensoni]|uniref:DOMON domain-containing protein n=1 Tax=Darwinula stevensoni TaxID=69355 RepID=A0A7R9FRA0_9CRUS|nr:unnamed protein product [Darwinula stevensoni]CAG0900923.1 unnamed protein product [Darwinula stevensoni]